MFQVDLSIAEGRCPPGLAVPVVPLRAHAVVPHVCQHVKTPLVKVEIQRWFIPVQHSKVELGAAGGQAHLHYKGRGVCVCVRVCVCACEKEKRREKGQRKFLEEETLIKK